MLLAIAVLALGLLPVDRDVVAYVRRGDELAAARQYSAALQAYRVAAHGCAGCPLPRLRQGEVYLIQERYGEAWGAYLNAIRVGGDGSDATEGLARLYAARGNRALATGALERLLARQPRRGELWAQMGEIQLAGGDERGARGAFARALALDNARDRQQRIHDRLGMLCIESDLPCAIEHFAAAAQGPDLDVARDAVRLLVALRILESGDGSSLAQAKLGEALLYHDDLLLAQRRFEMSVELSPDYVDGHAYLGHISSMVGEDERAEFHLERAIRLAPDYPLSHYFLGMHYVRKGWLVTGRDYLLQAYDLDPRNPAICAAVADAHLRADEALYAVAERWLHAAVDNDPGDVRWHLLLAHFYVDYNIDPGVLGVAVARVAVDLAPGNSEALETLGWAYYLGTEPEAALEPLLRARDLAPETARLHYRLGEVYRALGQARDARASYLRAVDLDWNGPVGQRARQAMKE